ncbi:hypothetical protein [Sphingomonas sp. S2-65]|nr:hypothetical protein [Sphingomonas sp. S2-65]UYY57091.1 hypothetical protein LZ586_10365 [Sphingomonas sp. S2-65]
MIAAARGAARLLSLDCWAISDQQRALKAIEQIKRAGKKPLDLRHGDG